MRHSIRTAAACALIAGIAVPAISDAQNVRANVNASVRLNATTSASSTRATSTVRAGINASTTAARLEAIRENPGVFQQRTNAKRVELITEINQRKNDRKIALEAAARIRVSDAISRIFTRMDNEIKRLVRIDIDMAARLNSAKNAGVNIDTAVAAYAAAQTALQDAKVTVEASKLAASAQLTANNETSKDSFRLLVRRAEDSIKATVTAYKKVLQSLPRPQGGPGVQGQVSASSSASFNR